ncbi:unnamed protein product [Peronospora belbahrii]|uniref:RWP-RK domain-containing protein n=1 Tax=Peronospora belbahrii TaxID=622444 RepID=A0AAU9L5N4_9STRA|nr:unnamed protein product [Peronospora belbahrii]CAH0521104.1 unnamed protein product [Peronospora belbahrii]
MTASNSITLDMLRPHFEEPLTKVAAGFGICVTLLKKICRRHGIARWPHRQITGLRKSIASMEHAIGYFDGARRDSYAQQLLKQKNKLAALLKDPTSNNPLLASEEDHRDQNVKKQTDLSLLHGTDNAYKMMPALPARASSPTGPLLLESPYHDVSSGAVHLPGSPMWLPPLESSCTHPYQELYPSSVLKQSHRELYPTTNYWPSSYNSPTSPIYLPPLRPDPRGVLPPISSLVVSKNKMYTPSMPTVSW